MKKLLMMTALCLLTAEQMAAQETTIRDSKMCDNWYIGLILSNGMEQKIDISDMREHVVTG